MITKRETPRRSLDGHIYTRDYVPRVFENGDYIFGSRCFSLLHLKWKGKSNSKNLSNREGLTAKRTAWLQTNYGMSKTSAQILVTRPVRDIRRIEDCVHGIIDSLLLFKWEMFVEHAPTLKTIRYLVRMILTIGTYDVGLIVSYWKEFNNFLYNRFAGFQPRLPVPPRKNFFHWALASDPDIVRMLKGDVDKRLCERFAHISSTRHLISGDRRAEEKSLRVFLSNVEKGYPLDPSFLETLRKGAERVGEKCRALAKQGAGYPHVSLNCAGSYYETVKDGGRGKEIRDSLIEYLRFRPTVDESLETPFGRLECPAGEPRWRYWARETPYTHYPEIDFGEVITEEVFAEQNLYYQGFDEAIGNQILAVSYLEYESWNRTGLSIPCRVLTVPEPGYKARIVTTGPFWLTTLQQSVAHVVKSYLASHPSSTSGLLKTDQAWQSLYLMGNKEYPSDFACLSSDLSEATDHIPKEVGILLLSGFIQGIGLKSNLVQTSLELLRTSREFVTDLGVSTKQTRGVMMGEPLTKGILTILNLVVEELAMRDYLGVNHSTSFYESPKWRSYHVGGDDHLAIGPREYLERITWYHTRAGSKISPGKHGISNVVVKYCEKVLEIRRIFKPFNPLRINDSTESYEASPFVDSIKLRLLSPLTKAFEVLAERNIAIGKGLSLGRTLKWMNKDHFPTKWVRMVRDRFFSRMGSLLPDRTSGVYWQLLLPRYWGGLDLYIPDEVGNLYNHLPELTLSIMEGYMLDEPSATKHVKLIRKFLSNYSYRGFQLDENEVAAMTSHVEQIMGYLPTRTWREIQAEYNPDGVNSAKTTTHNAYVDGWYGEEDVVDRLLRPILFKEILLGKQKPKPYNTARLKTRYATLWDLTFSGNSTLSEESFRKALAAKPQMPFYKVDYPPEIHFISDRGYTYGSALDDALNGMPVLRISHPFA